MDLAGFLIGVLAFGLSVWSLYLQFFRKSEHLFLNVTWAAKRTGPGDFLAVLTNGGDLSCVVCWYGFTFEVAVGSGGTSGWRPDATVETESEWLQLKPGDHAPIVIRLPKEIPESRLRDAVTKIEGGEARKTFSVVLRLEYVDSRGKRHLRDTAVGDQWFDEHGKSVGMSIISQTVDLSKPRHS